LTFFNISNIIHTLTSLLREDLKGEYFMALNLRTPRQTRKFFFKSVSERNSAFDVIDKMYPDVLIQKISPGAGLLVNLTDSAFYDGTVKASIISMGGHLC